MPIYEYKCADCGHRLEAIQKIADAPLSDCPTCGKPGLKRLISAAGFQLKGTGWYATDFKNSGRKQAANKDGGEKPSGDGATSGTENGASSGTENNASSGTENGAPGGGSGARGCAS